MPQLELARLDLGQVQQIVAQVQQVLGVVDGRLDVYRGDLRLLVLQHRDYAPQGRAELV